MGKSTEPTSTGRNGAGKLRPSCCKRRSLGPAAVAQPSDTNTDTNTNKLILVVGAPIVGAPKSPWANAQRCKTVSFF